MPPTHRALRRSLALALGACAWVAHGGAQTLLRSVSGPAANTLFGKACIVIPDQNGDHYQDLLVGAPGFNSQRGAVYCVSGLYLKLGTGTQTLWSVAPTANQGDLFGYALANVGDETGDGVADYLVGQPGYDTSTANDIGAVRLINGSTHTVIAIVDGVGGNAGDLFGSAIAACGDTDGDGMSEVAVAALGTPATFSSLWFLGGVWLHLSPHAYVAAYDVIQSSQTLGDSLASGVDLDGDGYQEVVAGYPTFDNIGHPDSGAILVCHAQGPTSSGVAFFSSTIANERLGTSLAAAHDYDGDGVADIVVGAPNTPGALNTEAGRAVVLSGAKLVAQTPPYEIYSLSLGLSPGPTPVTLHFGAAVRASDDLNDDGVGDILVGAPDYGSFSVGFGRGAVSIFSGATGLRLCSLAGATNDRIGDALAGAVGDLDGDGLHEFVVAGSRSDAGGTDSGVVKAYRLFPCAPSIYCTGKVNSLGCTPAISFSGSASQSSGAPFVITGSNFINQKNGLLFYSHQPLAVPFQGGTKCAANPTLRTPPQNSGGSPSGSDCSGIYSFDFNSWIANGWDASLAVGAEIFAQFWSRDPGTASHTGLSNAVRFVVNP